MFRNVYLPPIKTSLCVSGVSGNLIPLPGPGSVPPGHQGGLQIGNFIFPVYTTIQHSYVIDLGQELEIFITTLSVSLAQELYN